MKKRFILLIVFLLLNCLFGCSKSGNPGVRFSHSISDMIYCSFEEILKRANDAVLAKCIKIHDYPEGYQIIEFEIEKRYFGEDSGNIFVMPENDTTYAVNGYSYESSIIRYEEGQRYFLILSHSHTPVVDHDVYSFSVDFIPVEGITEKSLHFGKTPAECEDELFRELTKSFDNMDAFLTEYDASENLLYTGRKYVNTDDETVIIKESDYILKIVIDYRTMEKIASPDREVYQCTVLKAIKGTCEEGQELMIVFPENRVKPGEEYIVGLHLPYSELSKNKPEPREYINPKLLILSSKKIFLSMSEEEISAVLEN